MANLPHFAVLQKEAGNPSAEQIKRAFKSFSNLTDADAVRLAVSSRGILLRQLNRDSARAFQQALEAEGVSTAVVPEDELPRLPEGKMLHRLELKPEALVVYDLLGRPTNIGWNNMALVAAGAVRSFEFSKTQTERTELKLNAVTGVWPRKTTETGHKMEWDFALVLEMVLADGSVRYQVEGAEFPFKHVIDRPELSMPEKFVWLVHEICRHTPQASLNDGARAIRDGGQTVRQYDTRQMLADEMVWLLWNSAGRSSARGAMA